MVDAVPNFEDSSKIRIRLVVAIAAELVYLLGRSILISIVENPFYLEVIWTAWRLVFVLVYLWLFFDIAVNVGKRPLPRHPLLVVSVLVVLATMPFAHHGMVFEWYSALWDVVAIPIVALREELFYRAILQNALERAIHPVPAVLVATSLFALSHIGAQPMNVATVSSFVASGIVFGVVYQYTRNLWLVAALHAIADFLVWLPHSDPISPSVALIGNLIASSGALIWWLHRYSERRVEV